MKEIELLRRIKYLKEKLEIKYLNESIKEEIEEQIEFLEKLKKALYFY